MLQHPSFFTISLLNLIIIIIFDLRNFQVNYDQKL